jgi:phospholipase C
MSLRQILQGLVVLLALVPGSATPAAARPAGMDQIEHVIVLFMENRSFDNILGLFPTANNILAAYQIAPEVDKHGIPPQVDKQGKPYDVLPRPRNTNVRPAPEDSRFPANLPNQPFLINGYVPIEEKTGDLVHRWYQEQYQIHGGRMDRFVAVSDASGLTMSYYDGSALALWRYAEEFTLADNFFHGAFGGSFLNHMWLVCACIPKYDNAPPEIVTQLNSEGELPKDDTNDRAVTPEGWAVNTIESIYKPHSATITDTKLLLPPQTEPTIGDRLSEKNVSWAYYSGGWDDAMAGKPAPSFQFHHQPFAYFQQFADNTRAKREHLKDAEEFFRAIDSGTLPAVAFYKPLGANSMHSGYANLVDGDQEIQKVVEKVRSNPIIWNSSAIIVTFDENGGLWDHVSPPKVDQYGPGTRIPAVIISPFARHGYVDHTFYDTTSILKLIETRFHLAPLSDREARVGDLTNAFAFY